MHMRDEAIVKVSSLSMTSRPTGHTADRRSLKFGHGAVSYFLKNWDTKIIASTANMSQIAIIIAAAVRLIGLPCFITSRALTRHSANTVGGIIFIASATPSGINTRSSKYPKMGIGSGIRSIGLKAYPTTHAAKTLAYIGTLGSL
jgi:hypothetical protein